ncbi:hypothetical protein GCM10010276_84810 [Streptomyces longisporus]|uniref:DUF2277 domain-containing protein n=2 Tax=Streptomyces longisporus TaxID=1948 RepID=A0ABP6AR21_STRLO
MAGAGQQPGEQAADAAGAEDGHREWVVRHDSFVLPSVGPVVVAASRRIIAGTPELGETGLMCRSIKTLRPPVLPEEATEEEIRAAALQFVRKVSGFRAPAAHNREVFERAVEAVAAATAELLAGLEVRGQKASA